ncbi:MAG: acyltransferase [Lachnospiraceae bacterium]|nr:acyltransferase [Lachnospiraceae bacterium]
MMVAADSGIFIGNHVVISFDVTIYTTNSHSYDIEERHNDLYNTLYYLRGVNSSRNIDWSKIVSKDIVIEDDVWIGFGASILKGVTIGRGAIVGAKSVVTHDVEPFTVVAGNPAKIVKRIEH